MGKANITTGMILSYLKENSGVSSTQIANSLSINRVTVYYHLKGLVNRDEIYKMGNKNATRYFIAEFSNISGKEEKTLLFLKNNLIDAYSGLENIDILNFLNNTFSKLTAEGVWYYGFNALDIIISKEFGCTMTNDNRLKHRILELLELYFDEEMKRRKNSFFDGTMSLKKNLNNYDEACHINKLFFSQISVISGIGRLKCSDLIYEGKISQNELLLKNGINYGIDSICEYINKNNIKTVIFTPPTIPRKAQFRNILKKIIEQKGIVLKQIKCNKKTDSFLTLKPQKELRGKDRIINANNSMLLEKNVVNDAEIIIFDDSFTTGATVNAIARMYTEYGFNNKITVITIVGKFYNGANVIDEGDI